MVGTLGSDSKGIAAHFVEQTPYRKVFVPDTQGSPSIDSWQDESSGGQGSVSTEAIPDDNESDDYPKVVAESDEETVIDFTQSAPEKPEAPDAPNRKPEIENPSPDNPPTVNDNVTAPEPETPKSNEPAAGSTNENGEFYDPVFGWVKPGAVDQQVSDNDGDPSTISPAQRSTPRAHPV